MTAIIDSYSRLNVRSGDRSLIDWGSITTPTSPASIAGTTIAQPKTVTLEPGDSVVLWAWATDGDMALIEFFADGFVWQIEEVDLPTSPTDNTPQGTTSVNFPKRGVSCIGTERVQGMATPTVPSSTNYAAAKAHATTANGRRYSVTLINPADATANVTVTWAWCL